jgi:hypothetical protein
MAGNSIDVNVKLDPTLKKKLDDTTKKMVALVKKIMTSRKGMIDGYVAAFLRENPGTKISECELVEKSDFAQVTWYLQKKGVK